MSQHGYTEHGHPCCDDAPRQRPLSVARCGGPGLCDRCRNVAADFHSRTLIDEPPLGSLGRGELMAEIAIVPDGMTTTEASRIVEGAVKLGIYEIPAGGLMLIPFNSGTLMKPDGSKSWLANGPMVTPS